jgi:class 3 adenylate cyclase/tetratricopeptide (TPR) repeat protein
LELSAGQTLGTVTILFTDLVGSTELATRVGPTPADRVRQEHFALLRGVLAKHGGTEVKTLGDGLMVTFPGAAAGVGAAIAIQQALFRRNGSAEDQLAIRMGLALGDATREDGDYFGPPVVEAARLCTAAKGGQILVNELVQLAAAAYHDGEIRSVGSLELKGIANPVRVFEVDWRPPTGATMQLPAALRTLPEVAYVGRVVEREEIRRAWADVVAGARQTLLICGEPGIGKTRLATHGAFAARETGAAILCGTSNAELAVPYQPWIEIIGHAVTHGDRDVVAAQLAQSADQLTTLVPSLGTGGAPVADAETERYRLFDAVGRLLLALAEVHPLFVILDDLHWADRPSLLLLRHLTRACEHSPILFVCTYRDSDRTAGHPLRDAIAEMRRFGGVTKIVLEGLREQDLVDLLEAVTGEAAGADGLGLAAELRRETGGNPFFVAEMLRHLLDRGLVARDATGHWSMTVPLGEVGLPESLREVVGARVEGLGDEAASLLRTAAVIGQEFDLALLTGVTGRAVDAALDVLESAVAASVLVERPSGFAFVHALIRQTLYEDVGTTRRSVLHAQIAGVLERLPESERDARLGEIVHHWAASLQPSRGDKIVDYATRAGRRALEQLGPDAAARFFIQALEHLGPDRHSTFGLDLQIDLGAAQHQTGAPEARETLIGAARLARRLAEPRQEARALLTLSRLWPSLKAVDEELVEELELSLAVLPADDPARPEVEAMLAMELTYGAELERRLDLFESALEAAERNGAVDVLARVMVFGMFAVFAPDTIALRRRLEPRLIDVATAAGPLLEFHARWRTLYLAMEDGDLDTYEATLTEFARLSALLPHPEVRWANEFARTPGMIIRGRLDDAEAQALAAFGVGDGHAEDAPTIFGAELVSIRWEQGRLAEIADALREVAAQNPNMPLFGAIQAAALVEAGQVEEAGAMLAVSRASSYPEVRVDNTGMLAVLMWAEVARAAGDADAAVDLDGWIGRRDHGRVVWSGAGSFGPVSRVVGVLAATRGDHDRAVRCFEPAKELSIEIGAPLFEARARCDLGRSLDSGGASERARAGQELAAAADIWRKHGVVSLAERALARV